MTTQIRLSPEQEAWVAHEVKSGRFASAEQAVAEAIEALAERERQWRGEVRKGLEQLDRGEASVCSIEEIFDEARAEFDRDQVTQ